MEQTLFEKSSPGRKGYSLPETGVPDFKFPSHLLRKEKANLPELSEFDTVRHFTRLSQLNMSIDTNFYPLGSCTMKYNPRITEEVARYSGFSNHPEQDESTVQGNLELMYLLQKILCEISGMDACTLQPAAGAHGEFTGVLMMRAYHESKGNPRKKIIIPDSAHGTNPATAALCGYEVITVPTGKDGVLHAESLEGLLDEEVAGIMLTNPSTLGLFEKNIAEISKKIHAVGGLVYCDGANMNALMGVARPGDMGVDCMHFNLHKTFTTPHGGGGPGSGPVVVKKNLEPFLPVPVIECDRAIVRSFDRIENETNARSHDRTIEPLFHLNFNRPQSIGRVRAFFGNFGMMIRAYTYIREMGAKGLKEACERAVLNANYLRAKLENILSLAFTERSLHEVVFSDKFLKNTGIKTLDIAKRLIDFGFHPPTVYFPLVVSGSLMMEPTETENKQTLDSYCTAFEKIASEIKETPNLLLEAPHNTPVKRLNEVQAVRDPKLRETFSSCATC